MNQEARLMIDRMSRLMPSDPKVAELWSIPDWQASGRVVMSAEPIGVVFDGMPFNAQQMFELRLRIRGEWKA